MFVSPVGRDGGADGFVAKESDVAADEGVVAVAGEVAPLGSGGGGQGRGVEH